MDFLWSRLSHTLITPPLLYATRRIRFISAVSIKSDSSTRTNPLLLEISRISEREVVSDILKGLFTRTFRQSKIRVLPEPSAPTSHKMHTDSKCRYIYDNIMMHAKM